MSDYDQDYRSGWIHWYALEHPGADPWAARRAWLAAAPSRATVAQQGPNIKPHSSGRQAKAAKGAALTVCLVTLLAGCGSAPDTAVQSRARADFHLCEERLGAKVALTHVGPRGGLKWAADGEGVHALRTCLRSLGYRVHGNSAGPSRGLKATIKAETR